ncbi:MAG TPA: hypothetical protein VGR57_20080, partial [Ktedonobacterales bacterium]|nr:hypothetical protein [Ktedonobacterales bacterium]
EVHLSMRIPKRSLVIALTGLLVASTFAVAFVASRAPGAHAASISPQTVVPLTRVGVASFDSGPTATDTSTQPNEIDDATNSGDADSGGVGNSSDVGVNRTLPGAVTGNGSPVTPNAQPKSNPTLGTNFEGLNLFNQRFANKGNQFTVEPPDQGLCAGNGFVLESVNDVLRIYHTDGTPATGVIDLNTFYGYPAAINRTVTPNADGPSLTDPSCLFDQAIGRFINVVLTLDRVGTTPALAGPNHLDIAVSDTGDPRGTWTIFKLPVQNDGTQGTPNHNCNGPCLGDYPHIGADANGFYITTNEFSLFNPGFFGAQVYGIGNSLLTSGSGGSVVLFDTLGAGPDGAGFTVWPAQTPGNQFDGAHGGSEYFLSSDAVFSRTGKSTTILQWTMTNTSSLNSTSPSPSLDVSAIGVEQYAGPPRSRQPAGNRPLSQCIADPALFPPGNPLLRTCATTLAGISPTSPSLHNNTTFGPPNGSLNSNDSRMQQVSYANGKLWGALDTAISVGGQNRAGIAFYVIDPHSGQLDLQGQAGLAGADLTYPALGVLENGRGVMAFTLTGDNTFPSAAFAGLDAKVGLSDIQIAAAGVGPWDGFTSYTRFGSGRPRWGDYGAAAVDGNTVWISSEYVAQSCDYATYLATLGTCGNTRAPLGNWSTHISMVTP